MRYNLLIINTAFLILSFSTGFSYANELACRTLLGTNFSDVYDAPTKITGTKYFKEENGLPAFCDVIGYTAPQVGIQLRLPENWDGRFHMEGCGTLCGVRIIKNADDVLSLGTAVATTDMGHSAPLASTTWGQDSPDYNIVMRSGEWAYNNLEQEIDYAYRGTHKAILASKAIIEKYYQMSIETSYFRGCSTGGRQGLMLSQRYPWHFNGIISGAPAGIDPAYINIFWRTLANLTKQGRSIVANEKIPFLYKEVMNQCDKDDGLMDNILADPWSCSPDLEALSCKNSNNLNCFTRDELSVIEKLYRGAFLSDGIRASWGVPKGGELGLMRYLLNKKGEVAQFEPLARDRLRYTWFDYDPGPKYSPVDFNLDRDYPRLFTKGFLQAPNNPDLSEYRTRGSKLILYQGLNDMLNTEPLINYVNKAKRVTDKPYQTSDFLRLYLIPGMNHCRGGPGVDQFDWIQYIRNWVEQDRAPHTVIGYKLEPNSKQNISWPIAKKKILKSRPIYDYPNTAQYNGSGDPNHYSNFSPYKLEKFSN